MFPSNPFPFDSNLNSTQQSLIPPPPPFSFLHFPPPSFEDNDIFLPHHDNLLLLHHHHHHHQSQPLAEAAASASMEVVSNKNEQIPVRNKRICKRDRHSKIRTARGLRDRRMRLSLEVARRFFGLQDILGFDKASKTVEWLLNQSKDEIKQLAIDKNYNNCKSASSTSECEGVSGLDEVTLSGMNQEQEGDHQQRSLLVKRRTKNTRKSALLVDPLIVRKSREKAREKARERTKQKQKMDMNRKSLPEADDATNHNGNLTQFGSWNPFETGEKVNDNPSLEMMVEAAEEDERSSQPNKDDDSLAVNMAKWSPSMIFNSLNTSSTFLQDVSFNLPNFNSYMSTIITINSHVFISD